jgi:hypothetical protein
MILYIEIYIKNEINNNFCYIFLENDLFFNMIYQKNYILVYYLIEFKLF